MGINCPGNPREYPHKPFIARNHSHGATFLPLMVTFTQFFLVSSEKHILKVVEDPFILAPIKSMYATSYFGAILHRF